jgi:hypothetical protein
MVRITSSKNLCAGLLFVAVALAGLWVANDYPTGVALRMGPGYIPRLLLIGLLVLGCVIAIGGLLIEEADGGGGWAWRPLIIIPLAMVLFGLLLERFGLFVATIALVTGSSLARRGSRLVTTAMVSVGLAVAAVIFVWTLRLPIPVWPN